MKIIDGKILAEKIKDEVVKDVLKLNGVRPNLAIILVGERHDSEIYVRLKEQEAKKVGIDTHLYRCAEAISELELLEVVRCLNEDEMIDAILIQLPLPAAIDTDTIIMAMDPAKDVDGFHPDNLARLLSNCHPDVVMPPVFAVVLEMLDSINCDVMNKKVCVISNSDIFGKSLVHVLTCRGAQVEMAKPDDKDLADKTRQADILVTAVGRREFIKKDMIKEGAVIIDVGINKKGDKVAGDVDFEDVKERAGYVSPVPGGVGPMTIAMAFRNIVAIYKKRRNLK
jgi:methylenetetrahydrofolate dehydrogenase (NADP+) / methenyltetrahydrofolate cyclohydrolase